MSGEADTRLGIRTRIADFDIRMTVKARRARERARGRARRGVEATGDGLDLHPSTVWPRDDRPFWMGEGHHGTKPTAADVLDCLLSDATGDLHDFDTWCQEYGYDTDSRRAYRTWEACRRTRAELLGWFGSETTFDLFAYHTERL